MTSWPDRTHSSASAAPILPVPMMPMRAGAGVSPAAEATAAMKSVAIRAVGAQRVQSEPRRVAIMAAALLRTGDCRRLPL